MLCMLDTIAAKRGGCALRRVCKRESQALEEATFVPCEHSPAPLQLCQAACVCMCVHVCVCVRVCVRV